jgi:hypothetical protein
LLELTAKKWPVRVSWMLAIAHEHKGVRVFGVKQFLSIVLSVLTLVSASPGAYSRAFHSAAPAQVLVGAPVDVYAWGQDAELYYYVFGPYYYPPFLRLQEWPTVQVEPSVPAPRSATETQPPESWYYCESSKAYFPQVQYCATLWQHVIPREQNGQ